MVCTNIKIMMPNKNLKLNLLIFISIPIKYNVYNNHIKIFSKILTTLLWYNSLIIRNLFCNFVTLYKTKNYA